MPAVCLSAGAASWSTVPTRFVSVYRDESETRVTKPEAGGIPRDSMMSMSIFQILPGSRKTWR